MTKEELDLAFKKAFRDQASAVRAVDGEYLDYDLRQLAYSRLESANAEIDRLLEIERQMKAAATPSQEKGA